MSARNNKRNISHYTPAPVLIFGKGTGAGAANLTALQSAGAIASIAETGTGLYTITLADKFNSLLMFTGSVLDANSPDDWEVAMITETVSSTKTITIGVFKGGTLTDLTTDEKLYLSIWVSNSSRDL